MKIKAELLKMLRDEMMEEDRDERMEKMMMRGDDADDGPGKIKATIIAKDQEGIIKAAKDIPKMMSKAEKFMKARMDAKKK